MDAYLDPLRSTRAPGHSPEASGHHRHALAERLQHDLYAITLGVAIVFGLLALSKPMFATSSVLLLAFLDGIIAIAFAAIHLQTRHDRIPAERAHLVATIIVALIATSTLAHILLQARSLETATFILVVIGIGFFYTDPKWYWPVMGITVIVGLSIIPFASLLWERWPTYARFLAEGTLLSTLMFVTRRRTTLRLVALRQQEHERTHDLERSVEALGESEARFRHLAEHASDIVYRFRVRPPSGFDYISPAATRITGHRPEEYYHRPDLARDLVHTDDADVLARIVAGEPGPHELRWRTPAGDYKWTEVRNFAVRNEEGSLVAIEGIARDVTDRKAREEEFRTERGRLESLMRDMTVANRELELFGSSISHDLRAPLRGIEMMAQALMEEHGGEMSAESREMIERVRRDSGRLSKLVADLLHLASVTRAPIERIDLDMTALAEEVVNGLKRTEPARDVDITIHEDMHTRADPRLARIILENLIGNAWKYTVGRASARIEVGRDGRGAFYVRDDGAGFDPARSSRLFQPFQRLHGAEFDGTGLGLATVARLVQRHGGKVWAEGAVDKGATFHFTL